MRNFLRKLSRRVVLKRSLPDKYGRREVFVSPEVSLHYWSPNLRHVDSDLFRIIDQFVQPGDTVWDIGGNLGLFTFAAAHRVGEQGRCLTIEPDAWLVSLLQRSARLQADRQIDILPMAVSDEVGLARFNLAAASRATNFLASVMGSVVTGGVRQSVLVPTTTLDTLMAQHSHPNFIKIDVETAEHLVLAGARNVLTTDRPAIYCEVASETADAVKSLLSAHQYVLLDGEDSALTEIDHPVFNTLALPAEHWFLQRRKAATLQAN